MPSLPTWDDNTPFIKVRSGLIIPSSTRDVKYLLNSFSIITLIGNDNDETISCTLASRRLPSSNKDLYLFRKYSLPFTFCFCLLPFSVTSISISPDKKYMIVRTLKKPFSYTVPASGFPSTYAITDMNGKIVKHLADVPSSETAPSGNDNVMMAPRSFDWRDDEAATVTWCMPLDSGMIKKNIDFHDAVYALSAPFNTEAKQLFKTQMRFQGVTWGNATFAMISEGLRGKQKTQVSQYNPSTGEIFVLA